MSWADFWPVLLGCAVAALAWGSIAAALGQVLGRRNIIDTMWPLGFCLIAVVAAVLSPGLSGDGATRRWLLLILTLLWGLRLGWFVGRRSAGKGEDPRYAELVEHREGSPLVVAITYIAAPQTLILFVVSLTLQVGMAETGSVGWLGWLGLLCWAVGLTFEAVGDHQMGAFRADGRNKGQIMDRGLWHYTRHPNYFGDCAVWAGLYLIAASQSPGFWTFPCPLVMIYLLVNGTGKRLLERSMAKRDGYPDYMRRTSPILPLPPAVFKAITRHG